MKNMENLANKNIQLNMLKKPKNTILFDEISWLELSEQEQYELLN